MVSMMRNNLDAIRTHTGNHDYLSSLVQTILQLHQQVTKSEDQSFYFRSGIESNREKLKKLIEEFGEIRNSINRNTVADFRNIINLKQKALSDAENRQWTGSRFMRSMYLSTYRHSIRDIKLHLDIKKDITKIPKLETFLEQ